MKALLLSVVLCGNLDLDPEAMTLDEEMLNLPSNSMESFSARWPDFTGSPNSETRNPSSPWTNVEHLVHELRNYRDGMYYQQENTEFHTATNIDSLAVLAALQTQRQWPMHDATCPVPNCTEFKCIERPIARTQHIHEEIGRAKTMVSAIFHNTAKAKSHQLWTMLACQVCGSIKDSRGLCLPNLLIEP